MKSVVYALALALASFLGSAWAQGNPSVGEEDREKIRLIVKEVLREYAAKLNPQAGHQAAKPILKDILQTNRNFVKTHRPGYFEHFVDGQHPRATVVTCSDSRVHTHALDATPDGDLFMVRNIGNQMATAEGSVEYGVHHLHTPLLLFVGHSACGAIKAAAGDYSTESSSIKRELDTIMIPKHEPGLASVKLNVHNQVKAAMGKFEEEVINGHLTVVGAIYDFTNEMKQGQGRLNIINVNGEADLKVIGKFDFMLEEAPDKPAPRPHSSTYIPVPLASHAVEHKPVAKVEHPVESKVAHKPEAKVEHQAEAKSGHKPEAKMAAKPVHKPEAKPETKSEAKAEAAAKPVVEASAKPTKKRNFLNLPEKPAEFDVPSQVGPEKLEAGKVMAKTVAKPAAQAATKAAPPPEVKQVAKPAVQHEVKQAAKPVVKRRPQDEEED